MARHRIREALHSQIVNGECKPGSKLVQQRLARHFGVSMGLIREALLELQAWGLVEVHDNRGIYVCHWDGPKILESYELREVLEGLAARRCCGRVTEEQIRHLEELIEQIYTVTSAQQWDEGTQLEREFHGQIVHLSGSRMVRRLADNYRFLQKLVWFGCDPPGTREGHLAIVRAIRENDPEKAEKLARQHVAIGRLTAEAMIGSSDSFQPHWAR